MPTLSDFRTHFPSFTRTEDDLVTAKLTEAGRLVEEAVWGELHTDAVLYMAAHLLTLSPYGVNAATSDPAGKTTTVYSQHLDYLADRLPRRGLVASPRFTKV